MKNTVLVNEVYTKGWEAVNKEMEIKEIVKLFRTGKITAVNIVRDSRAPWGADFNFERFTRTYKSEIFEAVILTAKEQKKDRFNKFAGVQMRFTGCTVIDDLEVEEFQEGYYIEITGCQSGLKFFIDNTLTVTRKPRGIERISYYMARVKVAI